MEAEPAFAESGLRRFGWFANQPLPVGMTVVSVADNYRWFPLREQVCLLHTAGVQQPDHGSSRQWWPVRDSLAGLPQPDVALTALPDIGRIKRIARMKWTLNPELAWRRTRGRFRDPLFVFQMGKVGSTTLEETLEARYRYYHLHNRADFYSKCEPYRLDRRAKRAESFDIITAVRDPLARKISGFFQHLAIHPMLNPVDEYPFCFESVEAAQNAGMDELIARFRAWDDGIPEATEWFDRHFEPATGIRIYDHGFDPEKGWQIFREGKWRVLVLRFEDINKNFLDALNEFVVERYGESSRVDRLWPANLSSRKWYFDLMNEFRQNIQFSDTDIDAAYSTPYARYFYTDQELASMRSQWRKASTTSNATVDRNQ